MEERACWICGAGDFTPRLLAPAAGDVVVAADGGLAYLDGAGIVPNQILGDFDSLGRQPKGANVTAYPPEKDDTDMLLAVKYGLACGCRRFICTAAWAAGCRTPWRICRCSAFGGSGRLGRAGGRREHHHSVCPGTAVLCTGMYRDAFAICLRRRGGGCFYPRDEIQCRMHFPVAGLSSGHK